ncbi:MAG TPA: hypothetical protein P5291_10910, partial [Flavobacteriales bacterium]|nr:hypothetical protein [Flavobacteriales bacterium]
MASRRSRPTDDAKPAKLTKVALRKFFRVFRYMRGQRGLFAVGMVCLLLTSLLSAAFPFLIGKLIDARAGTGKIDLGLGRAPGTDRLTMRALRRDR